MTTDRPLLEVHRAESGILVAIGGIVFGCALAGVAVFGGIPFFWLRLLLGAVGALFVIAGPYVIWETLAGVPQLQLFHDRLVAKDLSEPVRWADVTSVELVQQQTAGRPDGAYHLVLHRSGDSVLTRPRIIVSGLDREPAAIVTAVREMIGDSPRPTESGCE